METKKHPRAAPSRKVGGTRAWHPLEGSMYHRRRYPTRRTQFRIRPTARPRTHLAHYLQVVGGAAVTTLVTAGINHLLR